MARKTSINDVFIQLDRLKDAINIAGDDITKYTSDVLLDDVSNRYLLFINSLENDPQDRSDTSFTTQRLSTGKYKVDISGSQIIYDEFGTGLPGKLSPHPLKSNYDLEPYLSGSKIKYPAKGIPYWRFKGHIAHGVPSGRFIYNSVMDLENSIDYKMMSELMYKQLNKIKQ